MNGNPVALSTPGHWYFVDNAQQDSNGQVLYHVGSQGTDLRGGSAWMTRAQIEGMAQSHGTVTAALYADNPTSPHPSIANSAPNGAGANAPMPQVQMDPSSPEAFIKSITPAAQWVQDHTGIPAAAMIGMAANETGYGKYADGNNLFGIKGSNPQTGANTGQVGTWEVVNGVRQNIQDAFRAYDNVTQSFQDFANLIQNSPRYAAALGQNTVEGFVGALKAGGYMTDPDYVGKIQSIVDRFKPAIDSATAGIGSGVSGAVNAVGSAASDVYGGLARSDVALADQGTGLINAANASTDALNASTAKVQARINAEADQRA